MILFLFVPILAGILLALNLLLAPHKPYEAKTSPYECGFLSIFGQTRSEFDIHFYVVAILFLVFDLEIILLFPLPKVLHVVGYFGFSIALIFFIILTIGFLLEIGSKAIEINRISTSKDLKY